MTRRWHRIPLPKTNLITDMTSPILKPEKRITYCRTPEHLRCGRVEESRQSVIQSVSRPGLAVCPVCVRSYSWYDDDVRHEFVSSGTAVGNIWKYSSTNTFEYHLLIWFQRTVTREGIWFGQSKASTIGIGKIRWDWSSTWFHRHRNNESVSVCSWTLEVWI